MVQRCCVPFCETKVGDADINGVKVRFHRMPMIPERFQQWRARITNYGQYKSEPELTVNSRICSKHFLKQDYLDNCQKPITGNHILIKGAIPSRFRWSSENCDVSAAIPFVRRVKPEQPTHNNNSYHHHNNTHQHHQQHQPRTSTTLISRSFSWEDGTCIAHSAFEKQTQCSFEDERLKNEISRKNSIIQQLLERISQLEAEHKATTQILLKDTLTGGGATTSVIRATVPSLKRDHPKESRDNRHNQNQQQHTTSVITHNNQNQNQSNNDSNIGSSSKKRKLQDEEEDENIHYVLLSLSEKVVRHDNGNLDPE